MAELAWLAWINAQDVILVFGANLAFSRVASLMQWTVLQLSVLLHEHVTYWQMLSV